MGEEIPVTRGTTLGPTGVSYHAERTDLLEGRHTQGMASESQFRKK